MKLVIIRHGDPDYKNDTLTEKGWREAALLAERVAKMDVTEFFVSPLGRARDTASLSLKRMGRTATELDWLQEFPPRIHRPDRPDKPNGTVSWDWLPEDWAENEIFYDRDNWWKMDVMEDGKVGENYRYVIEKFDAFLAEHGYVRDGKIYRAEKPNRDTYVFFCHFGLECVLLSRLMNVSPMILWHHMVAAPTSVTTVYSEERREGKAVFRISSFGDISHLYVAGEEPSFQARFCETFDCKEERHD